jgi:hypothetical protein
MTLTKNFEGFSVQYYNIGCGLRTSEASEVLTHPKILN